MYKARAVLPGHFDENKLRGVTGSLSDLSLSSSLFKARNDDGAPWKLEWILETPIEKQELIGRISVAMAASNLDSSTLSGSTCDIEKIPDIDWLAHSYKHVPPFSIGPFFIYGSHCEETPPAGQMGLQIDAATAFGSGEHGTTKGCLLAMLDLKEQGACPWNVLDMGTGSGILAIAAWKLWKTPVLAVDNDEEAVRVTERHREANKVPDGSANMVSAHGDGFKTDSVQARAPFDLIIANILAGPLKDMAEDLVKISDENGYVILSGILNEQAGSVLESYQAEGLILKDRYQLDGWTSLLLQNAA